MKKIIGVTILLLTTVFLKAQHSNCVVSERIADGPLAAEFISNKMIIGRFGEIISHFKMPVTSTEVKDSDWITCDGYMPNGAKIISIEIVSIAGLPEGLEWFCDDESCFYDGEETGCLIFQGSVSKKGNFPIEVNLKGVGSLWGIKKNYDCLIRKFEIVVE
jgi:hypothetical protein